MTLIDMAVPANARAVRMAALRGHCRLMGMGLKHSRLSMRDVLSGAEDVLGVKPRTFGRSRAGCKAAAEALDAALKEGRA